MLNYVGITQEQIHTSNHDISIVERELASDISQMTLAIDELAGHAVMPGLREALGALIRKPTTQMA